MHRMISFRHGLHGFTYPLSVKSVPEKKQTVMDCYLYSSQDLIAKSSGVIVQKALIKALARRAFIISGILRSIAARRIL